MKFTKCIVNKLPNGKYGFVGRVPLECFHLVYPASQSAIMGGRIATDEVGRLCEIKPMVFETRGEAESYLDNCID